MLYSLFLNFYIKTLINTSNHLNQIKNKKERKSLKKKKITKNTTV